MSLLWSSFKLSEGNWNFPKPENIKYCAQLKLFSKHHIQHGHYYNNDVLQTFLLMLVVLLNNINTLQTCIRKTLNNWLRSSYNNCSPFPSQYLTILCRPSFINKKNLEIMIRFLLFIISLTNTITNNIKYDKPHNNTNVLWQRSVTNSPLDRWPTD